MGILRLLLAIAVVLLHAGPLWSIRPINPQIPVETFFIISGFYMSLILDSKYTGKKGRILFFANRFLRIFPAYWAVLCATLLASIILGLSRGHWLGLAYYAKWDGHIGIPALLFSGITNLTILGQDLALFLGFDSQNKTLFFTPTFWKAQDPVWPFLIAPQAWSVSIELMFYLLAPFLLRKNLKTILALILTSFLLRLYLFFGLGLTEDPWSYRFFPTEIIFFLLGNISYRIYGVIKDRQDSVRKGIFFSILMFPALFYYLCFPAGKGAGSAPYFLLTMLAVPFIFHLTKNSKMDRIIGEFSYPVFLVHWNVLNFVQYFGARNVALWAVIFSLAAAFVLLRAVIEPIDNFRHRPIDRQAARS